MSALCLSVSEEGRVLTQEMWTGFQPSMWGSRYIIPQRDTYREGRRWEGRGGEGREGEYRMDTAYICMYVLDNTTRQLQGIVGRA